MTTINTQRRREEIMALVNYTVALRVVGAVLTLAERTSNFTEALRYCSEASEALVRFERRVGEAGVNKYWSQIVSLEERINAKREEIRTKFRDVQL